MASAEVTEVMSASIENIFKALTDYDSYPEFMEGVTATEVLERKGKNVKVEYSFNLIKKFTYTLNIVEEAPNKLSWTFGGGDLFKSNNGSWELEDLGDGTTRVTYKLDLSFKILVPKMITNKLVKTSLPSMMRALEERAS